MDSQKIQPSEDGVTHINIYSRGHSDLGRKLSHFSREYPLTHPQYGKWATLEGLWYFLSTGCTHYELAKMDGHLAKKHGKTLERVPHPNFKSEIRLAQLLRIVEHPALLKQFVDSTLPFTHYYYYGTPDNAKVVEADQDGWLVQGFEWLRSHLQGT